MNRIVAAWLVAGALLASGAATAQRQPDPIELSDEDNGRVYRVPVGAEFEVHLRGQVDDGYEWLMRDDPRFITVEPPTTQGYGRKRGDRQDRTFTVRVTQPGRFPLAFDRTATCCGYKRNVSQRVAFTIEAGVSDYPGPGYRDPRAAGYPPPPGRRAFPAPGPSIAPLREGDAGKLIHVPYGAEVVILLPYVDRLDQRWQVLGSRNIGLSRAIDERLDPSRKRNIFGLDATATIRLRPGGPGEAEVTFGYLPLEHGQRAVRQLRYRFIVE